LEDSAGRLLRALAFGCCLLSPGWLRAQSLTVIGGTSLQKQLTACIEHISVEDLDRLPGLDHSMTIIILERDRFLQVKDSFGAHRTKLAFSNLATRRMYLSSDVFRDLDTALRCIPHELGHFVTRSVYEDHAEMAAESIRKKVRQVCTMPIAPASPGTLSSSL
jgi:GGDEF domain-containing protein